jgi:hypothetical protein
MAEEKEEEFIDLDKLKPRELLIMLARDVKDLKVEASKAQTERHDIAIRMNTIETKNKVWAGIVGFFTALGVAALERLINR